ncbi:MAG TPA: lipoyl domain-containing protein [Burkholderiaceae bacterium]
MVVPLDAWDGSTEASVSVWFFEDGQVVQPGVLLAELMVEKATVEICAPAGGRLHIRAPAESVVRKGDVLAMIG